MLLLPIHVTEGSLPLLTERGALRSSTRHMPEVPLTCKLAKGACLLPVTIKAETLKKSVHILPSAPELFLTKSRKTRLEDCNCLLMKDYCSFRITQKIKIILKEANSMKRGKENQPQ